MRWLKGFYKVHGVWATIGLIVFVCIVVWMFGKKPSGKSAEKKR
ncbi:hypothetical protein MGA3_15016 [Bacillus methanolicus MGA3]|nr:hypothetical protein MGA3_15016 [Bacillus methanolicus MGA3]